uniref:Uncharacterized protein n=1 Tax=Leersia perrieri TaxID=77586 RepID=A0A0D9Y1F8_9ORYZ
MRPRKVLSTTPVFVVIVGHGFEGSSFSLLPHAAAAPHATTRSPPNREIFVWVGGPSPVPGKGSGIHSGGGWSRPTFGSTERRGIKWWFQSSRIQSKQREASFRQRMLSLRSSEQVLPSFLHTGVVLDNTYYVFSYLTQWSLAHIAAGGVDAGCRRLAGERRVWPLGDEAAGLAVAAPSLVNAKIA